MKKLFTLLLLITSIGSFAQIQKYTCTTISINGPDSASAYHWYKDGAVQAQTGKTYTETAPVGTYGYQLVIENAQGCTSPISDIYRVQVLPSLSVSISAPVTNVCATPGNSVVLTANVAGGYAYTYAWLRNGVAISGATSATYTVSESVVGNVTFSVNVGYVLAAECVGSASKVISVVGVVKPVIF